MLLPKSSHSFASISHLRGSGITTPKYVSFDGRDDSGAAPQYGASSQTGASAEDNAHSHRRGEGIREAAGQSDDDEAHGDLSMSHHDSDHDTYGTYLIIESNSNSPGKSRPATASSDEGPTQTQTQTTEQGASVRSARPSLIRDSSMFMPAGAGADVRSSPGKNVRISEGSQDQGSAG
jgi:hypothetical protein